MLILVEINVLLEVYYFLVNGSILLSCHHQDNMGILQKFVGNGIKR